MTPRVVRGRTVLCVAIMLAGLAVVGIAVWESVHYRESIDVVKAFLGVLVAVGGAWGLDPTGAHGFVGDAVSMANALPAGIIGAIRGGRRASDTVVSPAVIVAPPTPSAVPHDASDDPAPHEWAEGDPRDGVV